MNNLQKLAQNKRNLFKNNQKIINIDVVQGLGDIFWIYQKISHFFDKINLNICVVVDDEIQKRSLSWMKLFPKFNQIKKKLIVIIITTLLLQNLI